ncbi:MAG TPA: L-arabinose ABC transporter ATP-binding protein AraG [Opitutaceae bacterium]|nr:L-arabinose ABC transporter ATP-binding protein AraG [Opitutaceae bacterium]
MNASAENDAPYLEFCDVTKEFPGVSALKGVSFGVRRGSVLALLGENGAGKSTLLKTLSGAHRPTSGALKIGGCEHVFQNTSEAIAAGVAVIYQELHLVPEMTVAENIFIGHLPTRRGLIDVKTLRDDATKLLRRLGEEIDPSLPLKKLPIGQRQMVEIAKALSRGARVIAFDEPTSSLSAREIEKLFVVIRDLRAQGCAILYVTHRMEEVFNLCDACTVLRDGRHVNSHATMTGLTADTLVKEMVGRDINDVFGYTPRELGEPALQIEGVQGPGLRSGVSLSVARGEILGLFGLVGAGRTELLKALYGAVRKTAGTVRILETDTPIDSPRDAIRAGLVYCTEDRKKEGIIPLATIQENCNISARRHHVRLGGVINERWEAENARVQIESLRVKTPSLQQKIKNLSGGNQQKVILGRWLSEDVKVLLLDEPTRGIDVGAKSEIYKLIFDLARRGLGIVFVSSDLPEVLGMCDRIAVMRQGAISAVFSRAEALPEKVLAAALPFETASHS